MLADTCGPYESQCSREQNTWSSLCEADLENLNLASWISRGEEDDIYVNLACRRLLGVARCDQLTQRAWESGIHLDDRADYLRRWNLFVEGQAARFSDSVRWVRPDTGQIVKIAVRAQKLSGGRLQGWLRLANAELALSRLESLAKGA